MAQILQYLANGLVFSSIIILGSIGLSLVYSIADFANFAHGDTMTLGAYGAFVAFGVFGGLGGTVLGLPIGFFLSLAVGMALAAVVAVLTHILVYKPLDTDSIGLLITSIGVAFVYRAVLQATFGTDFLQYDISRSGPIPVLLDTLDVAVTQRDVAIIVSAAVLVAGLHLLLQRTTLGRKMRATADNPDLARVSGIRTDRVILVMWVVGSALAAAGGVFLALYSQLDPRIGFNILLVVFAAVILGGIGSVYGAMLGGLLIGMLHELTPLLSDVGLPVSNAYAPAVAFVIMVAVLLVRPRGIAGDMT
ncbi:MULTISPECIES: branched-chain amino acid ABC transporter permease [Haloarcula]|jgi:branched-chain amino acid transport system permease protein|uniref:Branched chain amino acid transporter permease n=2 Tax=Haloarcula marismortui TaxID=2238 RepID=M0K5S0_9EURY|nr:MULTISPECIES: branched-chain amino acid ABC transporter permease [Haloarcula]EMA15170.1 branched chain amino acid transporter permease [Haloarcula sinaiiensis ATCC 33800]EMA16707.1 branched chain amino acid transporter permease [Haloarcula californiae ATCC 33799]NHX40020.1 branched-chain amino acid ABC transporter permease [Haloarcula sp. R1-2]QUJ71972.1 branched-chain amino acid ABC transporter permease [Haloarcula sinaiiensis ATCC 33800]